MALDKGISLTEEQKQIISGHSQNIYPNDLARIIKSAEICRATESPRSVSYTHLDVYKRQGI